MFSDARTYHFWDCSERTAAIGSTPAATTFGALIPRPTGIDSATVYTDEHGEAILQFLPDVGASLTPDSNGRCDLGEVGPAAVLGTATIRAEAQDPYQLTFNDPRLSNTLTKTVFELAGKSLDCVAKSANEAFCVEVIRDIRGNPVVGAEVSFTREPRGLIIPAGIALGGYNTIGQTVVSTTADEVRVRTNSLGQAGVEIKSTLPGLVDVDAENIGTRNGGFGVQRVRCLRFAGNGTTLPTDGPTCVAPTDSGTPIPTTPPVVTRRPDAAELRLSGVDRLDRLDGLDRYGREPRRQPGARSCGAGRSEADRKGSSAQADVRAPRLPGWQAVPGRARQRRGQAGQGPDHARDADREGDEAGRAHHSHERGCPRRQPAGQQARPDGQGLAGSLAVLEPPVTRRGPHRGPLLYRGSCSHAPFVQ